MDFSLSLFSWWIRDKTLSYLEIGTISELSGGNLNQLAIATQHKENFKTLCEFLKSAHGIETLHADLEKLTLRQKIDSKILNIEIAKIEGIILRSDTEGVGFLQVNLQENKKLLVTSNLIGFKPAPLAELDLSKLPKVVTTQDLNSVFDAISEALYLGENPDDEMQLLKKIFDSVIAGGENIGFDLAKEKSWLRRLPIHAFHLSA